MKILGLNRESVIAFIVCAVIGFAWKFIPHPVLAVVIALLPFALLVVVGKTFLIVVGFIIFSFFRIHEVFPFLYSLKIPLLLSLAAISGLLWHLMITRNVKPFWTRELSVLSVFFLLVTIGVIAASNKPIALAYFKGIYWKIALMTFAIVYLTKKESHFYVISISSCIAGTVVAGKAIVNKLSGVGLVEGTRVTIGRDIGSVLGDPNDLALVLMFPAAFSLSIAVTKGIGSKLKVLGFISVGILIFAVISTQSRGGLLGIMAVLGFFGYREIKNKLVFYGLAGVATLALFVVAGISGRQSGGAAEAGIDASAMGRIYAWEAAVGMATDNPFTGVGIDNFYSNYYFYSPHWDGLNHAVHSTWFGVLAETGFLGLIVFIWLIAVLIKSAYSSLNCIEEHLHTVPAIIHSSALAGLSGLIGTIVSGTFLTQGFTWPIYILAALIIAIGHWVKSHLLSN